MNMTVDTAMAASMTDSRCWPNGTLGGILYEGREQFGDQQHPAHYREAGSDQEQAVVPRLGSRAAVGHARRPGPAAAAGALHGGPGHAGQRPRSGLPPPVRRERPAVAGDHRTGSGWYSAPRWWRAAQSPAAAAEMARTAGQSRAAAAGPVGNQPDHWLAADDGGGQAKVEQRGAAGNMQRAAIRIANAQHPRRAGVQADRLAWPGRTGNATAGCCASRGPWWLRLPAPRPSPAAGLLKSLAGPQFPALQQRARGAGSGCAPSRHGRQRAGGGFTAAHLWFLFRLRAAAVAGLKYLK